MRTTYIRDYSVAERLAHDLAVDYPQVRVVARLRGYVVRLTPSGPDYPNLPQIRGSAECGIFSSRVGRLAPNRW